MTKHILLYFIVIVKKNCVYLLYLLYLLFPPIKSIAENRSSSRINQTAKRRVPQFL